MSRTLMPRAWSARMRASKPGTHSDLPLVWQTRLALRLLGHRQLHLVRLEAQMARDRSRSHQLGRALTATEEVFWLGDRLQQFINDFAL